MQKTIITFGTFDLFHVGHLHILERARKHGDNLIVGISSDELNISKKNRKPIYTYNERKRIIESLKCVDKVFCEISLEDKVKYCKEHKADILIMGDDWKGKRSGKDNKTFDELLKGVCEVIYLERTPSISTTELIEKISFK
jgi:glycerol-3-phosphate cytidylyltransferase